MPKMLGGHLEKGVNQVPEPAACAISAKLWNLTEPQFLRYKGGSKSPGESGREMVDVNGIASVWYLAGA